MREIHIPRAVKRAFMVLSAGSVALFLVTVAFWVRAELAHRESRCPFHPMGEREVAPGVRVREEARRCMPDVEERRFWLLRAGSAPRHFAQRRLARRFFAEGTYRWSARAEDAAGLVLTLENDGLPPARFRETPPERPR